MTMATKKAEPKAAAPAAVKAPYRVGKWNGYDNYECSICGYPHLDKAVLIGHMKVRHNVTADAAPSSS